ncbi:DUF58 domain-containing protein [Natronomonas sp. EA1]|uniref:DUF58 domain-containing protein n=1 Tax=Natronomonas sp. EA1 TaxID=3421655 RepID=UPI003EBBE42D
MSLHVHTRWRFAVLLTFAVVTAGIALFEPSLVVAGLVPLGYVAYGYLSTPPSPELSVSRVVSAETPVPGSEVTVRLTVTNEGESIAPDIRIVDGVPGPIPVAEGSPRAAVTLLPGESTTLEYTVGARRGVYRFEDVSVRARSIPGGHVRTESLTADGADRLRCLQFIDAFPLPRQTRQYVGSSPAETGGEGVEFYGSREHQPTDPASRIDWNRLASTGELTTLVHREERSRTIVFLLDGMEASRVGGGEGTYTGVELSAYAIERGAYALLAENDSVGLAVFGQSLADRPTFVKPGGSDTTLERIRYVLAGIGPFVEGALSEAESADEREHTEPGETDDAPAEPATPAEPETPGEDAPASDSVEADGSGATTAQTVLAQTPRDAQYVLVSPLLDDGSLTSLEAFTEAGRTVTVLSPDVIRGDSIGSRIERVNRHRRIREARASGVWVIDWDAEEPLSAALVRGAAAGGGSTVEGTGWSDA